MHYIYFVYYVIICYYVYSNKHSFAVLKLFTQLLSLISNVHFLVLYEIFYKKISLSPKTLRRSLASNA